MQNVRAIYDSWMPLGHSSSYESARAHQDLGPALLQLVVGEIDNRATSKPADVIAALAFLAGRIVQRSVFRLDMDGFRLDKSANGIAFLRNDAVTNQLMPMKSGTLAAKLTECTLLAGATAFPDFQVVQQNAQEAMLRRAACHVPANTLSNTPDQLAAKVQVNIDTLLATTSEERHLTSGVFAACGLAIGYARHKVAPVAGAELAMSIALYAGWLDMRKFNVR
jgi:hypothetical protein